MKKIEITINANCKDFLGFTGVDDDEHCIQLLRQQDQRVHHRYLSYKKYKTIPKTFPKYQGE